MFFVISIILVLSAIIALLVSGAFICQALKAGLPI